ncbi:MAG: VWA domain-containing protein [Blastocatellia bacterium]|nr:VWA domain-containing protein [Blastocatellia bacterium]
MAFDFMRVNGMRFRSRPCCNLKRQSGVSRFVPRNLIAVLVLAGLMWTAPGEPRAAARLPLQDDEIVRLESDLVTVDVAATNARGEPVTDLKLHEIRLFEDGAARSIDFFASAALPDVSRPLAVVIALDTSGSITRDELEIQRRAALQFADLVRPESLFAVVAYNHEVKVLQKFTAEKRDISKAFDKIKDVGGATRIFDALDQSVSMLAKTPSTRSGRKMRRIVVTITDGIDSSSTINSIELIRRAVAANATIYSITLPSYIQALDGTRRRALTILDAHGIVPATGGVDFSADGDDYAPFFKAIAGDAAGGYQVAFYPSDAAKRDGKPHAVRIEVTRPGVQLRSSRQSYEILR